MPSGIPSAPPITPLAARGSEREPIDIYVEELANASLEDMNQQLDIIEDEAAQKIAEGVAAQPDPEEAEEAPEEEKEPRSLLDLLEQAEPAFVQSVQRRSGQPTLSRKYLSELPVKGNPKPSFLAALNGDVLTLEKYVKLQEARAEKMKRSSRGFISEASSAVQEKYALYFVLSGLMGLHEDYVGGTENKRRIMEVLISFTDLLSAALELNVRTMSSIFTNSKPWKKLAERIRLYNGLKGR